MFWIGLGLVGFMGSIAALAPLIAPHDPLFQFREEGLSLTGQPAGPSALFPLGADTSGRDFLSRLLFGARTSLVIALTANLIATTLGVIVGSVAAYVRSPEIRLRRTRLRVRLPVETLLMRFADLALSFPVLLLAIAVAAVVGPSMGLVILLISSILWATTARIIYARVLVLRDAEFVEAARAVGLRPARILFRHLMPHIVPLAVVYGSVGIAGTLLFEATLSFLGAGVPPPTPTWGSMIADGLSWYATDPRLATLPGLAILVTVLGFTLLGDALRDALDPRAHRHRQS